MALAEMISKARKEQGLQQAELAELVGKGRKWVIQLEKGYWYETKYEFTLEAGTAMRLAQALNLDPAEVLTAGKVPYEDWPKESYMRSINGNVRTINITGLSDTQATLISRLVDELLNGNANETRRDTTK